MMLTADYLIVNCEYISDELKEAIVAMMASKDDVEEQNRWAFIMME